MGVPAEKMAAHLRRAIQSVLDRGLHDPRVKGIVTVNRVDLSPDYNNATVHVTILPEKHAELSMHGLKAASTHVRSQVSRRAEFRRVPTLHFRLDAEAKRSSTVLAAIAEATRQDEERARARAEADAATPRRDQDSESPEALAAFDAFLADAGAPDDAAGGDQAPDGSGESRRESAGDATGRDPEETAT